MQADRDGKHLEFAEAYDSSDRKQKVLREVEKYSTNKDDLSEETLKELSVQRATTNGFFFTLKTLIKVESANLVASQAYCMQCSLSGMTAELEFLGTCLLFTISHTPNFSAWGCREGFLVNSCPVYLEFGIVTLYGECCPLFAVSHAEGPADTGLHCTKGSRQIHLLPHRDEPVLESRKTLGVQPSQQPSLGALHVGCIARYVRPSFLNLTFFFGF